MDVQRFKPSVSILLLSLLVLGACDERIMPPPDPGDEHGCESIDEPHPYLSCADSSPELHPACDVGCGYGIDAMGVGHMFCGMHCESDAECYVPKDGDSTPSCVSGTCHLYCDDDISCPSDLECISRGDPFGTEGPLWGECWAPYVEGA